MSFGRIGLALGGGGVKGLAHIPLLKVLDEYKLIPEKIVGTSMGAIVGALYASGLSGAEIELRVREHIIESGEPLKVIIQKRKQLYKWAKVFRLSKTKGGVVAANGLFEHLFTELLDKQFDDLAISFSAIATNFHTAEEHEIHTGDLLSAVLASMAVPGVFSPILREEKLLIDGGTVNNLPCDKLGDVELKIASDVISLSDQEEPSTSQVISGAINVLLTHNTRQRLQAYPPDILFKPDTTNIDTFDFLKIEEVLNRGESAAAHFRQELESKLHGKQ